MPVTDDNYFDHEADIGIIGYGSTIENAFINAAEAMFAFMVDDLVTWLNRLLAEARSANLVLARFELQHRNHHWQGKAYGEPWTEATVRGTEVKGATLTMLSVKQSKKTAGRHLV